MEEGNDARSAQKLQIIDDRIESAVPHFLHEAAPVLRRHCQRHIDVEAEPWSAVEDHSLSSEEIPTAPASEDGRERGQQLNGGWLQRHGGISRTAARVRRGLRRAQRKWATTD